ncbi:MAG TPA: hypothetical protein DEB39_03455, partial [Planctomycetaceae bacterium]|nr:hypothetical protein [Planctomycetaceae bacterium]
MYTECGKKILEADDSGARPSVRHRSPIAARTPPSVPKKEKRPDIRLENHRKNHRDFRIYWKRD